MRNERGRTIGMVRSARRSALLRSLVLGLAMVLPACGRPRIPPQPETGIVANFQSAAPVLRSVLLPLAGDGPSRTLQTYADGMVALSGLPWYHQGRDRTCAQANIAALLRYWGWPATYRGVVEEMNQANLPTDPGRIANYLNDKGLSAAYDGPATLDFVRAQILRGRPVLVLIDYGSLSYVHYVIVKGFNDQKGQLLLSDPVNGPNVVMGVDEFNRRWANPSLRVLPGLGLRFANLAFDIGPRLKAGVPFADSQ